MKETKMLTYPLPLFGKKVTLNQNLYFGILSSSTNTTEQ